MARAPLVVKYQRQVTVDEVVVEVGVEAPEVNVGQDILVGFVVEIDEGAHVLANDVEEREAVLIEREASCRRTARGCALRGALCWCLEIEELPVLGHMLVGRVDALERQPPAARKQSAFQGEGRGRLAVDADGIEDVRPEQAAERMVWWELGRRHRERVGEGQVGAEEVLIRVRVRVRARIGLGLRVRARLWV